MTTVGKRGYSSAAEYATSEIRRLILNGELPAGERLEQEQIAEQLGMSRLPIRQALDRLKEQGFIDMLPHRGAIVASLSVEDMVELYSARQRLETWALTDAWPHYTADVVGTLKDHLSQCEAAASSGDLDGFMAANRAFHLQMYAPAGNRHLQSIIVKLYDLSERYQRTSLRQSGRMQLSNTHHAEMLRVIEDSDLPGLLAAAEQHNRATRQSVESKIDA
ncbi:GntR family transcriptional regulator [Nitratireductor soli]|uniref:GntR family transcriptional regulator n=1 Tax=Nitratireductor soli TaxID=1670619 RepID=UPI00065E8FE9|nr:GntR family transcriptional regulator [Nitratireductor soli]